MLKSAPQSTDVDLGTKKRLQRAFPNKRTQSASPIITRPKSPQSPKKYGDRRSQSLSPPNQDCVNKTSQDKSETSLTTAPGSTPQNGEDSAYDLDKDPVVPQCVISRMMRIIATKKREFIKMRKNLISQQNALLDQYAQLKELEARAGITQDEAIGDIRILSVTTWPAHDILLLVREDLDVPITSEICGIFGPQVLQQMAAQLNPIPEEVLAICADIMARRIDLLGFMRTKHRGDRSTYLTNLEWKTRNSEFDNETEKLHRMVAGSAENLKAKINYVMELFKVPWIDRDTLVKKYERMQKENLILQHKLDEAQKKENQDSKAMELPEGVNNYQELCEELTKESAAREALKEVVSAAENMLRVARARIATLERQNKQFRNELEEARKKHKDLEQLSRHRETSFDARSRKLLEVSKTGEMTIEALSRQRDALELRVKELREIAQTAESSVSTRELEQKSLTDFLQAKVAEQEKTNSVLEGRVAELEAKLKESEDMLQVLRERSGRLVDLERRRCLDHVPTKENEPTDRETEIWKELQVTRVALSRAEEEVRQGRADKDSFLNSLSRIAQQQGETPESIQNKIATELLDKEQKIGKLKKNIEEQRENEKLMEQSMTQYENQLATLRLEVRRLRNYDCYVKEVSYEQLQTELLDLHMQVETLTRERSALVTAAASRALMLERHERSADLFAKVVRTRRELSALLEGQPEISTTDQNVELSRSLSSLHTTAAETWSALRAERSRVLRLESAVLAQSLQLEREGRVRTQLERRRAMLEREILRVHHSRPTSIVMGSPIAEATMSILTTADNDRVSV